LACSWIAIFLLVERSTNLLTCTLCLTGTKKFGAARLAENVVRSVARYQAIPSDNAIVSGSPKIIISEGTYVQRNTEARLRNHCCSGKAISIAYCECVFIAQGIQHAIRIRHVICDLPCPTFFHISSKRHDFQTKLLDIKCVFRFSLQLLSEIFFILGRTARDMIKKRYIGLYVKYPLFLSDFTET